MEREHGAGPANAPEDEPRIIVPSLPFRAVPVEPGKAAPALQPMTSLTGARAWLGGRDVMAMIEESGELSWAWNIGMGRARSVRLLTAGVEHFARTGRPLDWDWRRVLEEIFRGCHKPFLTGTEAQRILNCSSTLVMNLVRAGALNLLPGTQWQAGRAGSPLIGCESFVGFLEQRFIVPPELLFLKQAV